jgi:hypothetical protein
MKLVIIRKGEGVKRFEVVEREGGCQEYLKHISVLPMIFK